MDDNEIKKIWEQIANKIDTSDVNFTEVMLSTGIAKATNDILTRQKAEIERLNEEIKKEQLCNLRMTAHSVKTETIKEFAERLKKKANSRSYCTIWVSDVDNLLKEMEGEE